MTFLASVIGFLIAMGVLVTFHEYGHFSVARTMGVKVKRFSIGFGRPIWKKVAGADQTEYVIASIPLGGYVQMLDEREGDVDEAEQHRAFNRQSVWKRIAIVAAGPMANFVLAVVMFALMYMVGVSGIAPYVGAVAPQSLAERAGFQPQDRITAVNHQAVLSWQEARLSLIEQSLAAERLDVFVMDADEIPRVRKLDLQGQSVLDGTEEVLTRLGLSVWLPGQPQFIIRDELAEGAAVRDGFQDGDVVWAVNGQAIDNASQLRDWIAGNPGQSLTLEVERNGERVVQDLIPDAVNDNGKTIGRAGVYIGLWRSEEQTRMLQVTVQHGVFDALLRGAQKTVDLSLMTLRGIGQLITGRASLDNISGPVMIAEASGMAVLSGLAQYLFFLGVISLSIGILNLLPIPMLDGGHLLYYAIEVVKGSPVSDSVQAVGQRIGVALLLGLMSIAFFNDITRLIG